MERKKFDILNVFLDKIIFWIFYRFIITYVKFCV